MKRKSLLLCFVASFAMLLNLNNHNISVKAKSYNYAKDFVVDENDILSDFNSFYWTLDSTSGLYGDGWYQTPTAHSDIWHFTDQGLARKTNMTPIDDGATIFQNWQNWASLNTKDNYQYYTIETTLKFDDAKYNGGGALFEGRAGIQLNITNESQIPVYLGGLAFIIEPSNGALVYRKDGNAETAQDISNYDASLYDNKAYDRTAYQTLKLIVSSEGIEAYVDNVKRLTVLRDDLLNSKVGLASLCNDVFFKDLKITPLGKETKSYDFVCNDFLDDFSSYFFNLGSQYGATEYDQVEFDNYKLWGLTDKGLSRTTAKDKLRWNNYNWVNEGNLSSLVLNTKSYENFEVETSINFDTLAKTGCAGVQFAINNLSRPIYWSTGYGVFIDSLDGKVYLRSGIPSKTTEGLIDDNIFAYSDYNPSDYSGNTFNKKADNVLKVKAVGNEIKIYVNDVLRIDYQIDEENDGHGLSYGKLGLYAENDSSFFKNLLINKLDSTGNIALDPTSIEVHDIDNIEIGKKYNLDYTILPSGAIQSVECSYDGTKAIVNKDEIIFLESGNIDIKVMASESHDVFVIKTFNVLDKTAENGIEFPFNEDNFITYYQEGEEAQSALKDDFNSHYQVDDGIITRINNQGEVVSVDWANLYLNKNYSSFEIDYKLFYDQSNVGWQGIMFGKNSYTNSFFYDGDGAFISLSDANCYLWGQNVGASSDDGNNNVASLFNKDAWNLIKFKVFGNSVNKTVEMYVNDLDNPVISNTFASPIVEGKVCLFTTHTKTKLKDFNMFYLTENGQRIIYVPATSISINNKITEAKKGDSLFLDVKVLPETSTVKDFVYESSDKSIAIISDLGKVSFINPGNVVIKVLSKDNNELVDVMNVKVYPTVTTIKINNKIETAYVGDNLKLDVLMTQGVKDNGIIYKSSDESIATIDDQGNVTFIKQGNVTISVVSKENENKTDEMTINVLKASNKGCKNSLNNSFIGLFISLITLLLICRFKSKNC